MIDVCVQTLTRDGQYIVPCLKSILPSVKKVVVGIDSRSKAEVRFELLELQTKYDNLIIDEYKIKNPLKDLIKARNKMFELVEEKYVWILDDDEYYPYETVCEVATLLKCESKRIYCIKAWHPWNEIQAHQSTSLIWIARIFKNTSKLNWKETFGTEKLFNEEEWLNHKDSLDVGFIKNRYIHFTHVKKDIWRKKLKQERKVDARSLITMPDDVQEEILGILKKYGYKRNQTNKEYRKEM